MSNWQVKGTELSCILLINSHVDASAKLSHVSLILEAVLVILLKLWCKISQNKGLVFYLAKTATESFQMLQMAFNREAQRQLSIFKWFLNFKNRNLGKKHMNARTFESQKWGPLLKLSKAKAILSMWILKTAESKLKGRKTGIVAVKQIAPGAWKCPHTPLWISFWHSCPLPTLSLHWFHGTTSSPKWRVNLTLWRTLLLPQWKC